MACFAPGASDSQEASKITAAELLLGAGRSAREQLSMLNITKQGTCSEGIDQSFADLWRRLGSD